MQSYRFFVTGRVQGVYYRANVAKNAQNAGFNGYVKNLNDGRVEAAVSCEDRALAAFETILRNGSPSSQVNGIVQEKIEEQFNSGFSIC